MGSAECGVVRVGAWREGVIMVDGEGVAGVAAGDVAGQRLCGPGEADEPGGRWVELRDGRGKLQGKYDPAAGVLEIQRRGVRTRYVLGEAGDVALDRPD